MQQFTASSSASTASLALEEVGAALRAELGDQVPDLLVVFAGPHMGLAAGSLVEGLQAAVGAAPVVGMSASGVIHGAEEIESGAALVVSALVMPGVQVETFRVPPSSGEEDEADRVWAALAEPGSVAALWVFADPFSCDVEGLLAGLDASMPLASKAGALASGGHQPGTCTLYDERGAHHDGAVGVALSGEVHMDVVVGQGCRPVGPVFEVTSSEGPVVLEIDGQPALPLLREAIDGLEQEDRRTFSRAPLVGFSGGADADGGFVVRGLMGVDPKREAFAAGHLSESGERVQLHVRDPLSSVQDLSTQLVRWRRLHGAAPEVALLWTCVGRGRGFYGRPSVDARLVQEHLGELSLVGMFGQGEIGSLHGATRLLGHTAVLALLSSPRWN